LHAVLGGQRPRLGEQAALSNPRPPLDEQQAPLAAARIAQRGVDGREVQVAFEQAGQGRILSALSGVGSPTRETARTIVLEA
jgi:hypothetical protein